MYFCAMGESVRYDKDGHFMDDWAGWVHTTASSFADARRNFDRMCEEDADDDESMCVLGCKVQYQGGWYDLEELAAKLGIGLEPSTNLDELITDMAQAAAESAIEDQWIRMEQSMLRGRK